VSPTAARKKAGDLPQLNVETLDKIEKEFRQNPQAVLEQARSVTDAVMTEEQFRIRLGRTGRELRQASDIRESVRGSRTPGAPRLGAAAPLSIGSFTEDSTIPIDPDDTMFEGSADFLGWFVFAGPGFLFGGTGAVPVAERDDFRKHDGFASKFVYPVRNAGAGTPVEVALFSDFGTGRYHSLYIAKQIRESGADLAFHCGDVYYAGRKEEFREYVEEPLKDMFDTTDLYMINSNHEMLSGGKWYFDFIERKRANHSRQQQEGSYFCVRNSKFQILGLDSDYDRRGRLADGLKQWLTDRLNEGDALGLTNILLTANQPYRLGSNKPTKLLERDLKAIIGNRVRLWAWGNNHYCALFGRNPQFPFIGTCIGHGGYPYETLPRPLETDPPNDPPALFVEYRSRFHSTNIRPDRGNNGWCKMRLHDEGTIELIYIDWMGNERCNAVIAPGMQPVATFTKDP